MLDYKIRLDIRIVKFQDYIRRKPDKPFGYYGLGVQYLLSGKSSAADRMFTHALKINPCYAPAILGKIEFLLSEKRFAAAARFFHKHRTSLQQRNLYKTKINSIVSRLYLTRSFYRHTSRMWSLFVLREGSGALQRMFDRSLENPVVNILLTMFFLKEGKHDERSRVLYDLCSGLDGIEDKLRWDILQTLSRNNPSVLTDERIACMFKTIPEGAFGTNYADFLISRFIRQREKEKVIQAFSVLHKKHALPDKRTLWQYLVFCRDMGIWNQTVFFCCQKLILSGWVDRFLASILKDLKSRGLAENTREMERILSLYGY